MKRTLVVTATLATLFAGSAIAADTGFYMGGSVGSSKQDIFSSGPSDESSTVGSIYGGYNFNRNVGVEMSYNNFGETSIDGVNSVKTQSIDVDLVARMPVHEKVDLYGKAGVAYVDRDMDFAGGSDGQSGAAAKVGVGAEFRATDKVSLRAEISHYMGAPKFEGPGYEYKEDFTVFSVGANYKF